MEPEVLGECPLHGAGVHPEYLVGRRLEQVVASWHLYGSESLSGPLDVWLIDSEQVSTHVTTESDWCLTVERSAPYAGYDMAESGRVEVAPLRSEFADRLGETVRAVIEEREPITGRIALEITFDSARVRCETRSGDLRLSGVPGTASQQEQPWS